MNRFSLSPRFLVAAALATAALGAASIAEAHPDVSLSIGFQSGPVWYQPAPVYVQPRPVYVEPQPVYMQPAPEYFRPPVYVSPREVFEGPRFGRYDARREWERERAWRRAEGRRPEWRDELRGSYRDHYHEGDHDDHDDHDDRGDRGDRGDRKHPY